jgi:hypothetical protein
MNFASLPTSCVALCASPSVDWLVKITRGGEHHYKTIVAFSHRDDACEYGWELARTTVRVAQSRHEICALSEFDVSVSRFA